MQERMEVPDLESTKVKIALAFGAYAKDIVRLASCDLAGLTYLLASRQGLYAISETRCSLLAHGFFFGITVRGPHVFVFECCDLPHGPLPHGRIVRFTIESDRIEQVEVIAKGLDNGCHQIDFLDGRLHVLDTYNQQILRFHADEAGYELLQPLVAKPGRAWTGKDLDYRHVNSLLGVGDQTLLLLHNGAAHTGRQSEIAVYDKNWQETGRWPLAGSGCHDLALLEDGTVLTCGSMEGSLISPGNLKIKVGPLMTRGLAIHQDTIAVGGSELVERDGRLRNSGNVTFMDRNYQIRTVLKVPGAPTALRRLDGQDHSLSGFLATMPWGRSLDPAR